MMATIELGSYPAQCQCLILQSPEHATVMILPVKSTIDLLTGCQDGQTNVIIYIAARGSLSIP